MTRLSWTGEDLPEVEIEEKNDENEKWNLNCVEDEEEYWRMKKSLRFF